LDLMMGKDAREMVYEKIVHFMESDEWEYKNIYSSWLSKKLTKVIQIPQ
jgi:hypothetical protein